MKKIIFGILSILLISPVLAEDYFPSWTENTAISIESLTYNNNLTYYIYNSNSSQSKFGYLNNGGSISSLIPKYLSENQVSFGSSISSDYVSSIFSFGGLSNQSNDISYYSLLSFQLSSGSLPVLGSNALYFQNTSTSGIGNMLMSFGSNPIDYNYSSSITNSYIRYFYNTGFGFTGVTPSYSDYSYNPVGVQIFGSSFYTLTNKGKVYDYASRNSLNKNWVLSSYLDGYSYILSSGDNISFHSVLPGFSSFVTGFYNISTYFETNKFLMFRGNGNNYNGDHSLVGVLAFSGEDLLYSKYSCDGLSLTLQDDGLYHYNFGEACSLLDGGSVNIRPYNSICGYTSLYYFFTKTPGDTFIGCNPRSYVGKYLSLSFDSNNNLVLNSLSNYLYVGYTFTFPLTSIYGVDILDGFDNTYIPLTPEESRDRAYDIICKLNPNNPVCKEFGYTTGSYDVSFTPDGSGGLLATVTLYDEDDGSCPDIYFTGSDGVYYHQYFDRVCYNVAMIPREDSTPQEDLTSELTGLENNINLAFSGIVGENFKFYSCPFNSPLKAFHLSSIGGLSSFLLDKFFDVNLVGPFNCLLGGILYSETDSVSLGSRLLSDSYHGEKFLNNFPDDVKKTINWLLFACMVLFFWSFRPKDH